MVRKSLLTLMFFALLFGIQAGAKNISIISLSPSYGVMDNPAVPPAPEAPVDGSDEVIFFDDFESGQGDWTFVDLTDVSSWHVDDYNAYGGSGLSWWAGDSTLGGYDNHWLQYLVSPTIDLSGATNPELTFDLFYAVEEPTPYPPYDGWDGCNVWISTDDGATWEVLDMQTPAYNCQSLYSFGEEWGMGEGIAGWGGFSGGTRPGTWVDASASLSGYTTSTVKIRFALCSDPVWCTGDDPDLTGMFVDNIIIQEGSNRYLLNDAEGLAVPSDLVPTPGIPATGNYWHLSEPGLPTPPSPTHVMEMSDGAGSYVPDIFNALVSPVIDLTSYSPDSGSVLGDFYIRGSINVNDPDPFPNLDNWTVQVHPLGGNYGWYYYSNPWGQPGGQNYVITDLPPTYTLWSELNTEGPIDLSEYMGYEIQVRIIFQSDEDNYFGEGLFVDDFQIEYTNALDHDVAAEKLLVPMPTSAFFDTIFCSVELHNYGLYDEGSVPAFWRVNYGTNNPLFPWPSINHGEMVLEEFAWETPAPGSYFLDAFTQLVGDENPANDTSKAGLVEITDENVLEFGYDNRQYSYEPSVYYFNFDVGEGAYVKYTPEDDGIDFNMDGQSLKALFMDTGTIRIHIYEPGTASQPGAEVTSWDAAVTQVYPSWQEFDVSSVGFLQETRTDFWVWYEVLDASGQPHILGWNEFIHGEGHFFDNSGGGINPSYAEFFARAVFEPVVGIEDNASTAQPVAFNLTQNTPNPFNPTTQIEFSLEKAGAAKLSVFDLMGRTVAVLANGDYSAGVHRVTFDASGLASGIYVYRLEADGKVMEKKMIFLK